MQPADAISQQNKDVFYAIQDIVASPAFLDAQLDFYKNNMAKFDYEDENKLEYTPIYESYVTIMEQVIDVKLNEKYDDSIVQPFYVDFTEKWKQYSELDANLVNTLFVMTDFMKFKEAMLSHKKSFESTSKSGSSVSAKDMPSDEATFWKFFNQDPNDKSSGWNKRLVWTSHEGNLEAQFFTKAVEGYGIEWGRSECVFKDISYENFLVQAKDWEGMCNQSPLYKDVKVFERDQNGFPTLVKMSFDVGMFASTREGLFKCSFKDLGDGKALMIISSTINPAYPETDDAIRIDWYSAGYCQRCEDGKGIKYCEISYGDLKGYIPASLVNMTMTTTNREVIEMAYSWYKKHQ